MSFIVFAVWGSYLISLGNFLGAAGLSTRIGWFYAVQGLVALVTPALAGWVADRWVEAPKMLAACLTGFALFIASAAIYALTAERIEFGPLFSLYAAGVACFMPSIGLANSIAFSSLSRANLDRVNHFPTIRVFGTIGFVAAMLAVNFAKLQSSPTQLIVAASIAVGGALYALTLPRCPSAGRGKGGFARRSGFMALKMLKNETTAKFLLFSMLLGVALQITNSYGNLYISSFARMPQFSESWGAANANALISISQISEIACFFLIAAALKRFGIKRVILISMTAWSLRFALLGFGDTGERLWMLVAALAIYGIAFDFFNIAGGIYVDQLATPDIRSSAQGLFMAVTSGVGGTIGILSAQSVVNHFVFSQTSASAQLAGWRISWLIFAGYIAVVAIIFALAFNDKRKNNGVTGLTVTP